MTSKDILYLTFALAATIALSSLGSERGVERLAAWRPSAWLVRWVRWISAFLTILLLLDELGLLFLEWGMSPGPLGWLRWLEGLPGATHVLYFANLALVVPATFTVLMDEEEEQGAEAPPEVRVRAVATVLQFLALSLLLTAVQGFLWGEYTWPVGSVVTPTGAAVLILLAGALVRITTTQGRLWSRQESEVAPSVVLHRLNVWLLILAILLLQTMITKAALLLVLLPSAGRPVRAFLRRLVRSVDAGATQEPVTIEKLARQAKAGGNWRLAAYYLLLTSGFSSLVFWQSHAGPFPPAGSGYPKTLTISLIYTIDILVAVWAVSRLRPSRRLLVFSMALILFTRHALFFVTPAWFMPPVTPPGINPVSLFADVYGSPAAPAVISAGIHLLLFAVLLVNAGAMRESAAVFEVHDRSRLRALWRWTLGLEISQLLPTALIAGLLAGACRAAALDIATRSWAAERISRIQHELYAIGAFGVAVIGVGTLALAFHLYRERRSQPDKVWARLRQASGEEGVAAAVTAAPWAARLGRGRPAPGWDRLLMVYAVYGLCCAAAVAAMLAA